MPQALHCLEVSERKIAVGIDGSAFPSRRFLIAAELQLDGASHEHPMIAHNVSRTEPQRLKNVALIFAGAPKRSFCQADDRVSSSQVPIQRQRVFALGNALRRAVCENISRTQREM